MRMPEGFLWGGGTLVLTYRSAVKDSDNNLPFGEIVPVGYTELAGVTVAETESLQEWNAFPVEGQGPFAGSSGFGGVFRDMLEVRDAEVLYRYGDAFYTDFAAVTRRKEGPGTVYYLGCALDEGTTAKLMDTILADNGIETIPSPEGVEVVIRGDEEQKIRMVVNHNDHEVSFQGQMLAPFGCVVETL